MLPLWISSKGEVWFGLLSTHVEAVDTYEWSGTIWPNADWYSLQHRGIFAFPIYCLIGFTPYNHLNVQCFSLFEIQAKKKIFLGLLCRTKVGHVGNVGCFMWLVLFWRKAIHHMWFSCLNESFFPQMSLTLRTSGLHLK